MRICLIIILTLLLIWDSDFSQDTEEGLVVSTVDGKTYTVKKRFKDHKRASDILARLNYVNKTLIKHMQDKYGNSGHIDAGFLAENYNEEVLSEHVPETNVNTSYVVNKGDLIKLCLRSKKTGQFHDINTLTFVNLHELSHLLDKEYGHNKSFWRGFRTVLKEAELLGLYTPVDYSKKPKPYCGMTIESSPYYSSHSDFI